MFFVNAYIIHCTMFFFGGVVKSNLIWREVDLVKDDTLNLEVENIHPASVGHRGWSFWQDLVSNSCH